MNRLKSAENLLHQVALENFVRCNTLENLHTDGNLLPNTTSPTARRTRGCVQAGGPGRWFHLLC